MRRETSVERVNSWLTRDFGGGDFTEFMSNPLNFILAEGEGGVVFAWRGPGIYEVHVMLEQRGVEAFRVVRKALDQVEARLFWTAVPVTDRKVIMFARRMGWKPEGFADLPHGRCQIFTEEPCRH